MCEEHNLSKSNLDEYLMVNLSSKVGNNNVAYIHTLTKINRSLTRNPKLIDIDKEDIFEVNNKEYPILWVNVDTNKLIFSFESIARALYFYEYEVNFIGRCFVILELFFHPQNPEGVKNIKISIDLIERERRYWKNEIKGSNPDIFTYQFSEIDGFKCQTLALNFYGGTKVYIILNGMTNEEMDEARPNFIPITNSIYGKKSLES